jgi:lipoic acid synthetase
VKIRLVQGQVDKRNNECDCGLRRNDSSVTGLWRQFFHAAIVTYAREISNRSTTEVFPIATIKLVLVSIEPQPRSPRPDSPRPEWLRAPAPVGENYHNLKKLVQKLDLHTVCESAACPNIGDCWNRRTATFMILGNVCTRRCGFCAVRKGGPLPVDYDEPRRVAEACAALGLKFAVVTSVNRDDRKDGGAELFALTIQAIRARLPDCGIEVLTPDFQGSHAAMDIVLDASPDVLNHNTETVPRLYRQVRMGARYERSLDMLAYVKRQRPEIPTKSGLMLGLGETMEEVHRVMRDLRDSNVEILTLGQYLRPSLQHLPIIRHVAPDEFAELKRLGYEMGFKHVESGPLVRSSFHAADAVAS